MDFRCIKVHNDFLIAVGGVVLGVLLAFFFFFSRSCGSFDLFDVFGIV